MMKPQEPKPQEYSSAKKATNSRTFAERNKAKESFRRSASKLRSDDWEKKIAKKKCDRLKEKKRQQKLLLKLQKNVFLDHCYSFGDVQTLERKFMENTERLETLQKKLKIQLARNCQFKKDVNFMKEVIDDLREQKFVKKGDTEILQDFNGIAIPDLLFRRNKTNQLLNKHNREAYSPEIRKFAETLSSISMKAYDASIYNNRRFMNVFLSSIVLRLHYSYCAYRELQKLAATTPTFPGFLNSISIIKRMGSGSPPRKRPKRSKATKETKKEEVKEKVEDVLDVKKETESPSDERPDCTQTQKGKKSCNLKITSWNVAGVRAWIKKGSLSYLLETEKPDIFCLQETKCSETKIPCELKELKDYPHQFWAFAKKEGYSGVALFSKVKPLDVQVGLQSQDHDEEGRIIIAEFEFFFLLTTYVPNAGRKLVTLDKRLDWDLLLRKKMKELNKKKTRFTPEERAGFDDLLSLGFVDTYRKLNPEKTGAYTFWTYMMNARAKNVGWRLDYFLISDRWFESNVCDSVIRSKVLGSDHCPISLLLHV
ncbi:APEX1 [Lepeophtheirus salmonis]|uniref:DNA-(apurinic or apyrimidinic site) endonuclease n=1 Tax=Lepeophtheirus salmonis TaxID=72036 RepID=A0A7R8D0W7_LEPSM|nr:APEX1 [Lepeophtheirus salmonis]CAF2988505.1 APEX1 [Lepeophtheirus salmonis]